MNSWAQHLDAKQAASRLTKVSKESVTTAPKSHKMFKIEGKDEDIQIVQEDETGAV